LSFSLSVYILFVFLLSACLFARLSDYLSAYLSAYLYVSIFQSVLLYVYHPVCLSTFLSVFLSPCFYVYRHVCLSVCPSFHVPVYYMSVFLSSVKLSVFTFICPSFCLFSFIFVFSSVCCISIFLFTSRAFNYHILINILITQ